MHKSQAASFYIKTNRSFSLIRSYAWILTVLIGIGGQFIPRLGLLVPLIMMALMGMSLFRGKYWCGNFCPHGSFFDNLLQPLSRNTRIPGFLRSKYLIAAFLLFFMYNLGRRFIHVFEALGGAEFYDRMGLVFSTTYLMVLLAGGLLALTINARTWCQFCPMGTFQTLFYKLGKAIGLNKNTDLKVTITHPDLCHSCGKCARVCPMQLKPYKEFKESSQFRDENCIRCNTCVNNCPADALQLATPGEAEELNNDADLTGFKDASSYRAAVKTIKNLKDNVREYTFKLVEPQKMDFHPGQFVLVETDPEIEMYRAYTISGSSNDRSEISITVKLLNDGYGTNLLFNNLVEGTELKLKGPLGNELKVDPQGKELFFLANGIGITPFVSIVQSFFERKDNGFKGKATLLYGARYEEDLVYDDYFVNIAENNESFNYYRLLSKPRTDQYNKGYVTDQLKELSPPDHTKVYICGTTEMAVNARDILASKGVREDNIFYECFL